MKTISKSINEVTVMELSNYIIQYEPRFSKYLQSNKNGNKIKEEVNNYFFNLAMENASPNYLKKMKKAKTEKQRFKIYEWAFDKAVNFQTNLTQKQKEITVKNKKILFLMKADKLEEEYRKESHDYYEKAYKTELLREKVEKELRVTMLMMLSENIKDFYDSKRKRSSKCKK